MNLTKRLFSIFFLSSCLLMSPAYADELPELTRFLREKIETANQSLRHKAVGPASLSDSYVLRYWYLRLQALIGVDVPWIASFQIVPEVELMFERSQVR